MSGIFGIVALDGGTARQADLDAMAAELARRGPDGTHFWREGNAALGHTLLATTPEALVEVLPLTDADSGCTITADCRLDNREELIEALGVDAHARVIGDGELILRAYLQWGEDCPTKLLGDFAFAIWDPREQRLFCARDHMGMRQLIYHHQPGKLFAFATEVEAVLKHPAVPRRINEARIADFLDEMEGIDQASTFFEQLFRLPPAHLLVSRDKDISLRRYWQLAPAQELNLPTDKAYADAFKEVLTEAVRCRLRSAGPIGAMVSGGLDSSSVAAIAADLTQDSKVRSFSAVSPSDESCRETRAINSVLSSGKFEVTTISFAELEPHRDELARAIEEIADPFDAHMNLVRLIYLAAHRKGVAVMLDGMGGDLALTAGNRIGQLLRAGRVQAAVSEARGEADFWGLGQRPAHLLALGAWAGFAPRFLRNAKAAASNWLADRRAMRGRGAHVRSFAAKTRLASRRHQFRQHHHGLSPIDASYQLQSIAHPHTTAARERYDRVASRFAIEPRDPFLDIRVLQFCLSLPREQLRSGGWTKLVLRRAMAGLLAPDVAWRRGKEHLGLHFTEALIDEIPRWDTLWCRQSLALANMSSLVARRPPERLTAKNFIELFSLSCWLSRYHVANR